jgi:OTU-like cysteine protease
MEYNNLLIPTSTVGDCMQSNSLTDIASFMRLSLRRQSEYITGMIQGSQYGEEAKNFVSSLCKELIKEPINKDTLSIQRFELIRSISDYFQRIPELKETELEALLNLFDHTGFPRAYSDLERILNSHPELGHVVYEFAQTRAFNTLNSIWGRVLDTILKKPYLSLDDGELQSLDNKLVEAIQGGSIKKEIVDHVKAYFKYKFSLGKKSTTKLMDCIFVKVTNYLENSDDMSSLFDVCVEIEEEFHDQFKSRYLHLLDQLRQKKKPELKKLFCQYTRRYSISHKEIPHQFKEKLETFAKDKSSFTLSDQAKQLLQDLNSASPPIQVIPIENYPKPKDANPSYYSHSLLVQRPSPIKPITADEILVVLSSSEKLSEESLSRLAPRKLHPESQRGIVEATECLVAEWCNDPINRETRKQVETQIKSFFRFLASPPKDYTRVYKNDLLIKCWSLLNPELKKALDPTGIIEREIFRVEERREPRSSSFSSNQNPVTLHDLGEKLLEIAETRTSYSGQHTASVGNLLKQAAYSILADERKEEKTIELMKKLDEIYKGISKGKKSHLVAAKVVKQAILEWICLLYKDDYPITLLSALKKGKILVSLDYLSSILDENPHINIRSLHIWQLIATILNQSPDVFHLFKQRYFQLRYCIREDKLQEKIEVDEEFLSSFTDHLPMKHLCNISFYYSSNQNERYILIQIKDDYLAWKISYNHQQQLQTGFSRWKLGDNIDLSEIFSSVFEEMIEDQEYKHLSNILDNDTDTEQFIQDLKLKLLKIVGAEVPAELSEMQLSEGLCHNVIHGYISARYRQDFHKIRSNKSLHVEGSVLPRPDLLCISKDKKHAIIFEFKFSQDANCSKNSPASALLQITNQYISHPYWRDAEREHSHRTSVQYILAVGLEFHFVNGRCDILKQIKRFARDEDRNFREINSSLNFPTFIHERSELHLKLLRRPGMLISQIQKILQEFSSHNFPNQQRELFEGMVMGILASLLRVTHFKRLSNACGGGYLLKEEGVGYYPIRVADNNKVRWDSLESNLREAAGQWSPLLKQALDADELKRTLWCFVLAMENRKRGEGKVVIGAFRLDQPDNIRICNPDDHTCYLEHQLYNSSSVNFAEDAAVLESVCQPVSSSNLQLGGLSHQAIPRDGHCLFNAVALYLEETQEWLRKFVAAHLEHNLDTFRCFLQLQGRRVEDYINDVREGVEWASHVEIEILMQLLDRPIMVVGPNGSLRNADDQERFNGEPIFVYYNGHNHYDALLLTGKKEAKAILEGLLSFQATTSQQPLAQLNEHSPILEVSQQQSLGVSLPEQANCIVIEDINQLGINESSSKRAIDKESEIASINKKLKIACQSQSSAEVPQRPGFFGSTSSSTTTESVSLTVSSGRLQLVGLNYQVIPGDGHCLFNAMALYLGETQEWLRQLVAAHLEHNLDIFRCFLQLQGRRVEDYINDVREGVEWASHVEIEILMRLLDRPIMVIDPNGSLRNADDQERFNGEPIFVYYNGHNHYDALLLTGEKESRAILNDLLLSQTTVSQQPLTQLSEHSQQKLPLTAHQPIKSLSELQLATLQSVVQGFFARKHYASLTQGQHIRVTYEENNNLLILEDSSSSKIENNPVLKGV